MITAFNTFPESWVEQEGKGYKRLLDLDLPKVPSPRYLYHSNYYDGPLSGVCLYEGAKCWFKCIDEVSFVDSDEDLIAGRVFIIQQLTEEDLKEEKLNHDCFCKYVGTHTDYGEDGKRTIGAKPASWWVRILARLGFNTSKLYYWRKFPNSDYQHRKVLAWYEESDLSLDAILTKAMSNNEGN